MHLKYPKVTLTKTNQVYVSVYHNNNRLRLFSGKRFNVKIYHNGNKLNIKKIFQIPPIVLKISKTAVDLV